ncbi:hypothetical protein GbCGDNIH2_5038 [Granulibacter bethesdensis]|nr:hypothetical protein GbCGDNIH2_5038 [Granulibacter bethesdensis]
MTPLLALAGHSMEAYSMQVIGHGRSRLWLIGVRFSNGKAQP